MRARLAGWAARALVPVARFVARLPRPVLALKLRAAEAVLRRIDRAHPALGPLAEVREIAERDAAGLAAIRRLLLEGRREQTFSVLRGMLLHRALAAPVVDDVTARLAKTARTGGALTVAVVGDTDDARLLRDAYAGTPGCRVVDDFAAARIAEVADPDAAREEAVADLLRRGVAVSLHPEARVPPDAVARHLETAKRAGAAFRVFHPVLDYPPLAKVRALLAANTIGEVATVRVRAILGGSGGGLSPVPPDDADPFAHPAFDHFALLAALGGEIAAATAYLAPMAAGGAGLVAVRFAHPERTGSLEVVHAPEMVIPSAHRPYDLEAEIAGTDGIVWLRRGMAKRTQVPAVELRVGTQWLRFGVGSGLPEDWEDAHRAAAARLAARVRGIGGPAIDDRALLSALRARAVAREAATRAEVMSLSS